MSGMTWSLAGVDVFAVSAASGVFGVYIAVLAAVVFRYSARNLAGDGARGRFLGWLVMTVVSVEGLVFAGNFAVFLVFWLGTSTGVHNLLEHFRDRPGARLVAWEKFLVSRIGDAALVAAAVILGLDQGTLNFAELAAASWTGAAGPTAAVLVVVGALTKSAQVPFHSWLPRTLEAPTSVSALLHAGIINAGGFLLVRFGFLVQHQDAALALLVVLGALTAVWGGFSMLVQADIKRRLAWSTVGQMGFMMVEIGLGAPALALVHLMGHGLYKARSFLWSGEAKTGLAPAAEDTKRRAQVVAALGLWALAGAGAAVLLAVFWPSHLVLTLVVWAALVPLAAGGASRPGSGPRSAGSAAAVLGASLVVAWGAAPLFGLADYQGRSIPAQAAGLLAVLGLAASGAIVVLAPWLASQRWYRALYGSALHGFGWGRWPEILALRLQGGR